jgi:hypothetical protein
VETGWNVGTTKKIASLMLAFGVVAASCGGGTSSTTTRADLSADTIDTANAPDTTVADRDRNVESAGWGADGSGLATAKVANISRTTADVRVFRRVRIDTSNGLRVVSTQDAFVTVLTQRTERGKTSAQIAVHGFVTRDGGVKNYTMQGFGENGISTIDMPDRGESWPVAPMSWTVVSRETIALLFANTDERADTVGVIEYRKLSTGELDKRFGNAGTVEITRTAFGVSAVQDLAVRMVEDNGAPHLVLLGADNLSDGFTKDLFVFGLNPDGSHDTAVGRNGAASVKGVLGDNTFAIGYLPRLADPGVDNTGKAMGLVATTTFMDFDPDDGVTPATQIGYLYADLPADDPKNVAILVEPAATRFPMAMNAVLDPAGRRFAVLTSDPEGELARILVTRDPRGLVTSSSPQANNMKGRSIGIFSVSMSVIGGTWFGAQIASHGEDDGMPTSADVVICFDERHCAEGDTAVTRNAIDVPVDAFVPYTATALRFDANGVNVAVARLDQKGGAGVVGFTGSGAARSNDAPQLIGDFSVAWLTRNGPVTSRPTLANAGTLVATRAGGFGEGMSHVVVNTAGSTTKVLKVSPALGVTAYAWDAEHTAVLDATSMVVSSMSNNADGKLVTKLHKLSLDNGSTLVPFGAGDAIEIPEMPSMQGNRCGIVGVLTANQGIGAYAQYEPVYLANLNGLGPVCQRAPQAINWTAFLADGTATHATATDPQFDIREVVFDVVVGKTGALYVLSMLSQSTDDNRGARMLPRVRKFLSTGKLDTSFGVGGVATFDELTDDVFQGFYDPAIGIDDAGRVYLAAVRPEGDTQSVAVVRLNVAGAVDRAPGQVAHPLNYGTQQATRDEVLRRRATLLSQAATVANTVPSGDVPVVPVVTVTGDRPVLLSVAAIEDRSLTATWGLSVAAGDVYVTATASPGGRSCTSREKSCVIRGLDPAETYTIVVSKKGDPVPDPTTSIQPAIKPVRVLRTGQVASPSTLVRPASRGKATWRVGGKCTLNESLTKFTTPKSPGRCRLAVTTAKDGKIPKTTRSVTIVVKK